MAEITDIKKTPAVAAKVHGATLNFTTDELAYLQTALEVAYKAHRSSTSFYVAPVAKSLYKTVQAAIKGDYKPAPSMQDVLSTAYAPVAPRFA